MSDRASRDDVLKANVYIHTSLVDLYDDQPHFRPENKQKVSAILTEIRKAVEPGVKGRARLLDMGCGTGFLIGLADPIFDEIHGVDITPAMLEKIDTSSGRITLHNAPAEHTPFEQDTFDVVTAYSFMDHLHALEPFLVEVHRVLRPGGVFYSDQNANRAFWAALGQLDPGSLATHSTVLQREMTAGLRSEEEFAKKRNIDTEAFRLAEYLKTRENGIDADDVVVLVRKIGFQSCSVKYDWFLGQGKVMHTQSFEEARVIEQYLHEVEPLSHHLFKYLRFDLRK